MFKIITALLIVIGVGFVLYQTDIKNSLQPNETSEVTSLPPTNDRLMQPNLPSGWQSYMNQDLRFQIGYPKNMRVESNGEQSILFVPESPATGQGEPTFLYVSYIKNSDKEKEGVFYNYQKDQIQKLKNAMVNTTVSISDANGQDEWYTYTRFTDETVGGKKALVFKNTKPWEFPQGTTETRYIVETDDALYLLGYYIQESNTTEPFTKITMEQMIQTVSFLTGDEILQ
jgi:hypothetical protein